MSCEGPAFSVCQGGTRLLRSDVHPLPPPFAVIFKDEHENHTACEVWLVIRFLTLILLTWRIW